MAWPSRVLKRTKKGQDINDRVMPPCHNYLANTQCCVVYIVPHCGLPCLESRVSENNQSYILTQGEIQCHDFQLQHRIPYPQNDETSCENAGYNYPIPT